MQDIGPCKKHIKVTVDRADIDERLNEKFSELVGATPTCAGFRPGKAPRKIIERRFHKDVTDQVKAECSAEPGTARRGARRRPAELPELDPAKIEIPKEGPFVYEFDVEVRPQFDLPNYKGLKLRRPVRTFTDDDVDEEERRLLAPYGQLVPKPEGNAQIGDYLIADMTTRDGDRVIGEIKEVTIRVEPRLAFKDGVAERFGEQVKGAKAGETRMVDITLSDSVADAGLRGQTVQATFDIKDVKTLRLPELTHEFLHRFGVHSPEQLRERIRVLLEWRLEYQQRQSAREQVLAQIAAAATWELPQDLLVRQARKALARRVMEMRASGMSEEEIRGRQRLLQQDVLQSTALALKEHFVLQKIAEVEKIDVNDDDINDEIERMAAQQRRVAAPRPGPAGEGRPAGRPGRRDDRAQGARPDPGQRRVRGRAARPGRRKRRWPPSKNRPCPARCRTRPPWPPKQREGRSRRRRSRALEGEPRSQAPVRSSSLREVARRLRHRQPSMSRMKEPDPCLNSNAVLALRAADPALPRLRPAAANDPGRPAAGEPHRLPGQLAEINGSRHHRLPGQHHHRSCCTCSTRTAPRRSISTSTARAAR